MKAKDGESMIAFSMMLDTPEAAESFEEIYNANKDIMYAHAYSILKDVPSAEDAVSDSFISLARNFSRTREMDSTHLRSYLVIIARNAAYKIYNKRKREVSTEDVFNDDNAPADKDFTLNTEKKELHKKLFDMIKTLEPKYGDIIMLKYYYGMKDKEIAASLDISLENVKVRSYRARLLLKKMLKEGGYCD